MKKIFEEEIHKEMKWFSVAIILFIFLISFVIFIGVQNG